MERRENYGKQQRMIPCFVINVVTCFRVLSKRRLKMNEFADEIAKAYSSLIQRRNELRDEVFSASIKKSGLERELNSIEEWIEQMTPIGKLRGAFDYLQSLSESARNET